MIDAEIEEQVIKMSQDIDAFFEEYLEQNEDVSLLHFFSIVLARMTAISQATGTGTTYKRLLEEVLKIIEMKESANEHGNYH
jgi:hypothetical protein